MPPVSTTARTTSLRKRRPHGKPPFAGTTSTQSSGSPKFERSEQRQRTARRLEQLGRNIPRTVARCFSPVGDRTQTRGAFTKRDSQYLGEVRHESTPRTRNAYAACAAEVRGHNQQIIFDCILQQRTSNARSFEHIDGSVGRQLGIEHLHWSVDRITAENCWCTAIGANAQLSGSMTRQWQQCQAFG